MRRIAIVVSGWMSRCGARVNPRLGASTIVLLFIVGCWGTPGTKRPGATGTIEVFRAKSLEEVGTIATDMAGRGYCWLDLEGTGDGAWLIVMQHCRG
jgi:hypothetical protein